MIDPILEQASKTLMFKQFGMLQPNVRPHGKQLWQKCYTPDRFLAWLQELRLEFSASRGLR